MKTTIVPVPAYPGLRGLSAADIEDFGRDYLPGWLGMQLVTVDKRRVTARVKLRREMLGPHGYLHGGIQVSIADSLAGWGTVLNLPAGASGMLTTELKTNYLGSMRDGGPRRGNPGASRSHDAGLGLRADQRGDRSPTLRVSVHPGDPLGPTRHRSVALRRFVPEAACQRQGA